MTSDYSELHFRDAPTIRVPPPGPMASERLLRQEKSHSRVLSYPVQYPLVPERGLGATVVDVDGNVFIDFSSGQGVLNVGHCHPEVVKAIKAQAEKLAHGLDFPGLPRLELAEKVLEMIPAEMRGRSKVFFSSPSGAEAVESAIKLAKYHTGRPGVITFEGGWHGTSGTALAATGRRAYKERFLPVVPEVYSVPYPYCYRCAFGHSYPSCELQCAKFLEHIVRDPDSGATRPACIILEAIQGEGGFIVPPDGYLQAVRRIASDHGLILIIDEVMSGFGRTGLTFACEHWGVSPDIMVISKSLGGGLPLAGIVIREEFDTWTSGSHVGTFRGNLVSCAAGLAAVGVIERQELALRAAHLGTVVLDRLRRAAETSRFAGDVRGRGLFVGVEFVRDKERREPAPEVAAEICRRCFEKGLFLMMGGRHKNVIRVVPALTITEALLQAGLDIFEQTLMQMQSWSAGSPSGERAGDRS